MLSFEEQKKQGGVLALIGLRFGYFKHENVFSSSSYISLQTGFFPSQHEISEFAVLKN